MLRQTCDKCGGKMVKNGTTYKHYVSDLRRCKRVQRWRCSTCRRVTIIQPKKLVGGK